LYEGRSAAIADPADSANATALMANRIFFMAKLLLPLFVDCRARRNVPNDSLHINDGIPIFEQKARRMRLLSVAFLTDVINPQHISD
jgi:hypothetical protein